MNKTHSVISWGFCALVALLGGCSPQPAPVSEPAAQAQSSSSLILATTTSTEDSGLLGHLLPTFEAKTGTMVKVIAVGSGQAMELGKRGEADVLLVHSPKAEEAFMAAGAGQDRRPVMHNDFVLVGPSSDPAGVKGEASASAAMAKIAAKSAAFVSRGDKSGTHSKELRLWEAAAVSPSGVWHIESGAGMGETLRIASEKQAYTLSDRATFLATSNLELVVLGEGDPALLNPYHVISVVSPKVNTAGAKAFADFLTGSEGRALIAGFRCPKSGAPLFFPDPSEPQK